jgi:hypothetical protein
MRLCRARFTIRLFMLVVAVAAFALAPFAWSSPESRGRLLLSVLTVVTFLLILRSPFLIDCLEGGRTPLKPRTTQTKPLPRLLQPVVCSASPHRTEPPQ